jgi:serine/threonine-protein kinase
MISTDLGACEWFVWDLRRSNLIDRGQLDQVIGEFLNKNPGAEPPGLAEYLVHQGILTDFQAERLLQGKTQGFVLGPFTLMDALGTGSMGTVYKAQSKTDSKWYAVKVLPRRSMWNVRIARRKVRSFEQCEHPAVVPFIDVGTAGGMHYLAWPLVEGETLDKIVARQTRLSPDQTALYALQTAEGLQLCHQQGLFHGLLKPSNLMIGPDGQLRILDFGIGCLLAETEGESLVDTMSTANSVNSGLDCSSPESIMDPTNLNAIGDQYSLGCVMYFCLTGRYPFPEGTAVDKMMCHQHKQPTPVKELAPEVPDNLVAVVERLMHKTPAARYASWAELIEALRPFAQALAPTMRRVTKTVRSLPKFTVPKPGAAHATVSVPMVAPATTNPAAKEPAAPPSEPAAPARLAPRTGQPLPPRAPSAAARQNQPPAETSAPGAAAAPAIRPNAKRLTGLGRNNPSPASSPPPASRPAAYNEGADAAEVIEYVQPGPEGAFPSAPADPRDGGQKLGTFGVVLMAIIAGVTAWLLSSFLPLK